MFKITYEAMQAVYCNTYLLCDGVLLIEMWILFAALWYSNFHFYLGRCKKIQRNDYLNWLFKIARGSLTNWTTLMSVYVWFSYKFSLFQSKRMEEVTKKIAPCKINHKNEKKNLVKSSDLAKKVLQRGWVPVL